MEFIEQSQYSSPIPSSPIPAPINNVQWSMLGNFFLSFQFPFKYVRAILGWWFPPAPGRTLQNPDTQNHRLFLFTNEPLVNHWFHWGIDAVFQSKVYAVIEC